MSGCDNRTARLNEQRMQAAKNGAKAQERVKGKPPPNKRVFECAKKSPFRSYRTMGKEPESVGKIANPETDTYF
jgi:hypothetical protein